MGKEIILKLIEEAIYKNEDIKHLFNQYEDECELRMDKHSCTNNICLHKENARGCMSDNCPDILDKIKKSKFLKQKKYLMSLMKDNRRRGYGISEDFNKLRNICPYRLDRSDVVSKCTHKCQDMKCRCLEVYCPYVKEIDQEVTLIKRKNKKRKPAITFDHAKYKLLEMIKKELKRGNEIEDLFFRFQYFCEFSVYAHICMCTYTTERCIPKNCPSLKYIKRKIECNTTKGESDMNFNETLKRIEEVYMIGESITGDIIANLFIYLSNVCSYKLSYCSHKTNCEIGICEVTHCPYICEMIVRSDKAKAGKVIPKSDTEMIIRINDTVFINDELDDWYITKDHFDNKDGISCSVKTLDKYGIYLAGQRRLEQALSHAHLTITDIKKFIKFGSKFEVSVIGFIQRKISGMELVYNTKEKRNSQDVLYINITYDENEEVKDIDIRYNDIQL